TLAACGGSTADHSTRATSGATQVSPPSGATVPQKDYSNYYPPGTHKASQEAIRVITRWSDELRTGHVRKAAGEFALPAIVQNATPPLRLTTRRDVLQFNEKLPCGAHVVRTLAGNSYTVATFVLTERPGGESAGGCGSTGKLAAIAFLLRDGKISE